MLEGYLEVVRDERLLGEEDIQQDETIVHSMLENVVNCHSTLRM